MSPNFPPVALPKAPFAAEMQAHCLSFDGAFEDYPWGDVVYKVGAKMFAAIGGDDVLNVTVKASMEDAEALLALPFVSRARYVGRYGWLTVEVSDESALDLVRDLIAASYARVAPKRRPRRA